MSHVARFVNRLDPPRLTIFQRPKLCSTGQPERMSPMPTDLERRRAIDTAASMYLAEEPLDMSLLAERLGVGRATL